MNDSRDSLQRAISFYNEGQFEPALLYLEDIIQKEPGNFVAKEYAGIVSLRLGNYDKALGYFEMLSKTPGLYANSGEFYYSLTLLKRNRPGDVQRAKTMLQRIVADNGTKASDASILLREL